MNTTVDPLRHARLFRIAGRFFDSHLSPLATVPSSAPSWVDPLRHTVNASPNDYVNESPVCGDRCRPGGWSQAVPAAGIVCPVLAGTYRDLFAAIAGCAGALTGLLFVAVSVSPRWGKQTSPQVIQQVRAAAALLAFTNALAVSLFGLVPGTNVGYPALALGVIGLLFTAAGMRSIFSSRSMLRRHWRRQIGLIALLLVIFGTELVNGAIVLSNPADRSSVQAITYAIVASLIVGVARAWELVSDRDTGIIASIAVLTGHDHPLSGRDGEPAPAAEPAPDATRNPGP